MPIGYQKYKDRKKSHRYQGEVKDFFLWRGYIVQIHTNKEAKEIPKAWVIIKQDTKTIHINETCNLLSKRELTACLYHEVGHIIYEREKPLSLLCYQYELSYRYNMEKIADNLAIKHGYANELYKVLSKVYEDCYKFKYNISMKTIKRRLSYISLFLNNKDKRRVSVKLTSL